MRATNITSRSRTWWPYGARRITATGVVTWHQCAKYARTWSRRSNYFRRCRTIWDMCPMWGPGRVSISCRFPYTFVLVVFSPWLLNFLMKRCPCYLLPSSVFFYTYLIFQFWAPTHFSSFKFSILQYIGFPFPFTVYTKPVYIQARSAHPLHSMLLDLCPYLDVICSSSTDIQRKRYPWRCMPSPPV